MEIGVVKFFNNRDNKYFGFIMLENREEIFFHFNDGATVKCGKNKPEYIFGTSVRIPMSGDRVVFERRNSKKGVIASPWAYADDYERALEFISKRKKV